MEIEEILKQKRLDTKMGYTKEETKVIDETFLFILRIIEFNTSMENFINDAFRIEKRKRKCDKTIIKMCIIDAFKKGRNSNALRLSYMSEGYRLAAMAGAAYYDQVKRKYILRSNWIKFLKMCKECEEIENAMHKRTVEALASKF